MLLGFLLRGADGGVDFLVERGVALVVPFAERDEMRLQPRDRVAQRPFLGLALGAVAGRVVGGRMALGAIGEEFDQGRALVGPRPLATPSAPRHRPRARHCRRRAGRRCHSRSRGWRRSPARPRRCPEKLEIAHWLLTTARITGAW